MELRQAISELSPILRAPLIMRHYGGFHYEEIAERMGCPVGTARRRVWTAMQKLKAALGAPEEVPAMKCEQVRDTLLLDYLYGTLPKRKVQAVKAHLGRCAACSEEAEELRKVMSALDAEEGDYLMTQVMDIHEDGTSTGYCWSSFTNDFGKTAETSWWHIMRDSVILYAAYQGQEAVFRVSPCDPRQFMYEARLARPVEPGGRVDSVLVTRDPCKRSAEYVGDGRWRLPYKTTPNSAKDWVFALAIRLPTGAKLVSAEPEPAKVRANATTTLTWRAFLPKAAQRPDESWPEWQFECTVEYDLPGSEARDISGECPPLPVPPEKLAVADRIYALSGGTPTEQVVEVFAEAGRVGPDYPQPLCLLGLALYEQRCYDEALSAFTPAIELAQPWSYWDGLYAAHSEAGRGAILDLLGRREEAIAAYQHALEIVGTGTYSFSTHGISNNRKWLEERLTSPFVRR